MKKAVVLPALLFLFSLHSYSQKNINYGILLGGNATNVDGKGIKDNYNAGYMAGVFARIQLEKKWSIQPEVFYNHVAAQRGSDFLALYNVNGYVYSNPQIKLDYVSVPVLVCYRVTKALTINAGPQYNLLFDDDENLVNNNKAAFKWNGAGAVAGVQLNLEIIKFFADYEWDITNINNIDARYKWYDRQAYLGLSFNIK